MQSMWREEAGVNLVSKWRDATTKKIETVYPKGVEMPMKSHVLESARVAVFEICADLDTLRCSRSGVVTGVLFLRIDGAAFPEPTWNDAIVRVLSSWCSTCRYLVSGGMTGDFMFEDGAYGFEVSGAGEEKCLICYSWGQKKAEVIRSAVSFEEVVGEVRGACKRVWNACARHGWDLPDVRKLEDGWRGL